MRNQRKRNRRFGRYEICGDESRKKKENLSERDLAFIKECERQRTKSENRGMTGRELARKVAESEAPGYYLSYDHAMRIIRTQSGERRGSPIRRRDEELRRRTNNTARQRRISHGEALRLVLESKATSFFMSRETAERVYYRHAAEKEAEGIKMNINRTIKE